MKAPHTPDNESGRLLALQSYQVLDTLDEEEYDSITKVASEICRTPITVISLVDKDRQWFKSKVGIEASETAREISFCAHAINSPDDIFIISDARKDDRFHDNPLVTGFPNIVFYAGVPLVDENGYALGTLCALDNQPRMLTESQLSALRVLSKKVVMLLSLKKKQIQLEHEKKFLFDAISFSSPFFLIMNRQNEIIAFGDNYKKSIPELSAGSNFDEHFVWETKIDLESIFANNIVPQKLIFFAEKKANLRFKCSFKRYDEHTLIAFATAVINSQIPISNYKLSLNDFPKHDYITEFLFLQQAATKGLEDSKKLNESLLARNKDLEEARKNLTNVNVVLEKRVEERTKKIRNLALFPEQNPNPVFEIDYLDRKISYINPAAKSKIRDCESLSYERLTELFKISENTIKSKDITKKEFEVQGEIYERNIFFLDDLKTLRLYLHNITDIRKKELEEREKSKSFIRQQEVLLHLRGLSQEMSLEEKLKFIHQKTSEILDCHRCSIWLYNDDKTAITSDFIYLALNNVFANGTSIFSKDVPNYFNALEQREVIAATNAATHPATSEFAIPYLKPLNIVSMLDTPLIQAEKSIGVIRNEYIGNKKEFSDNDISFARSVADVIILAYETEQLKKSQEALREKNQSLKDAMERLVAMQADVIQQEKLATLGMLIAGIAHEINTPLGAIKASNENINNTFSSVLIGEAAKMDGELFKSAISLLLLHRKHSTVLSTREERTIIRKIETEVTEKIKEAKGRYSFFARKIYELGFTELVDELLPYLNSEHSVELFGFACNMTNIMKSVDTIGLAVDRASSVVKALNQFSHGNINKEQADFKLRESIDSIITLLWNKIKRGAQVIVDISGDITVFGNQEELSQVWTNILNNALQACDNKCTIQITHKLANGFSEIEISNNGPKIPEDVIPKIFDPFFSTKKRGEGTGLGLNIVKKIIEKHQGKITCVSDDKKTAFIIQLPVAHNSSE
ncbi:MAG: ATP-binding protein [Bacteroidota bacterium]|jgi:signal transduction histidine kinase